LFDPSLSVVTTSLPPQKLALEIYSRAQEVNLGYLSFDTASNGIITFAALNANGSDLRTDPQVLISTSTGNIQLVEGAQQKWNRDEALTTSVVSGFVELPPPKAIVGNHEGETFVQRVVRHTGDLQVRMFMVVQTEYMRTGFLSLFRDYQPTSYTSFNGSLPTNQSLSPPKLTSRQVKNSIVTNSVSVKSSSSQRCLEKCMGWTLLQVK